MKELTIPEIEKKYKDEWLLFEVEEEDKICNPIRGKLVAHSPSRAAIYEVMLREKRHHVYLTYTGDKPRKGVVSAL